MALSVMRAVHRNETRRALRRERLFRERNNPLDMYDEIELFSRYRFGRQAIMDIVNEIGEDIYHFHKRKGFLPALSQILLALRFFASGTFQEVVGDLFGVSQPTISRTVEKVATVLARRIATHVNLPGPHESEIMKRRFYAMAGFPNVIGCIDCTHINISTPSINEHEYVNRKNNHSINVQLICDADTKIVNCVVKWPGSVHDARILRESEIYTMFDTPPRRLDGVFLGDNGYMLKEWLLTPFIHVTTADQQRYNDVHCCTRSTIERYNGILKRRWSCLRSELRCKPRKACNIIMACIVLHNKAVELKLPVPDLDDDCDDDVGNGDDSITTETHERSMSGKALRDRIVSNYFNN